MKQLQVEPWEPAENARHLKQKAWFKGFLWGLAVGHVVTLFYMLAVK